MPRNRLDRSFERRLSGLVNARETGVLTGGLKGVEREALRVLPEGRISQAPHPRALGSTLTHPHITTDYSEALIELVTPPFDRSWDSSSTSAMSTSSSTGNWATSSSGSRACPV